MASTGLLDPVWKAMEYSRLSESELSGDGTDPRRPRSRKERMRACLSFSAPWIMITQAALIVLLGAALLLKQPTPYLEDNHLEYVEFTEQNHLMQPSIYRGKPTFEIEDAWIKLWRLPMIHFPEENMARLNKTPTDIYTHTKKGPDGEMLASLNVFHLLHCVNFVRQYTYRDEYDYRNVSQFRAPADIVRGHVDHCIETLRKSIMCSADVTPVVYINDPSRPAGRRADFNLPRKCRNYSKIQEWAMEHRSHAWWDD
ncbi:hypothetical protein F5Y17DRAFT_457425 [Xylariaceae sp. FL0594]|nr:hypothetical protein F5Y17DRAFT_457425 [Xylariaceae sp. FL0594]